AHYLEGADNVPPAKVMLAHDIQGAGLVFRDTNIRLTTIENCHYHFSKGSPGYHWQQSFAFRLETPDRLIVLSGATGPRGDVLVQFAKQADLLVHEVIDLPEIEAALRTGSPPGVDSSPQRRLALLNHMRTEHSTAEEAGRVAQLAGVRKLVLTHIVPGRSSDSDSRYTDAAQKQYSGPVVVGRDLMELR